MGGHSRKKVVGRIERFIAEIDRNPRLESVFMVCKDLGIDDPIHWFQHTSPTVVDWWVAYYSLVSKRERDAYESATKGSELMDPADVNAQLSKMVSQNVK